MSLALFHAASFGSVHCMPRYSKQVTEFAIEASFQGLF